jgi:excisionase family DNA binding protein
MSKLLSIREAAEALNVSPNTVRGLCKRRKIRHERHGLGRGVIRIPPDAIEEYRSSVTVRPSDIQRLPPAPVRKRLRNLSRD